MFALSSAQIYSECRRYGTNYRRLEQAGAQFRAAAEQAVDRLYAACAARDTADGRPQGAARSGLQETLPTFFPRIPAMVAIGTALRATLPED